MKTNFCLLCFLIPLTALAAPTREPLTPDNVQRLSLAWTYDTRDPTGRLGGDKPPAFEATPTYADGRLYLSTPLGTVSALDAETGAEYWRVNLGVATDHGYSDPANRGLALKGNRLYVGTIDARLVCLQRRDGSRCPGFGINGQVDLTQGLRHPPQWAGEYGTTSRPALWRNLVIVGSNIADNSRARMASGEVRAFDATTGALKWTFHPLPADSPAGGANAWSRIEVDELAGIVYVPTGSPSPDYYGGLRPGNNGYANSIVALKAETGEVIWSFQTVHHDLWDYDVASPPLLWPSLRGPAVAVGSKTGHIFLFNRLTGAPLFPIEERPVPASDVPGELASPTQPFPHQTCRARAAAAARRGSLGADACGSGGLPPDASFAAQRGYLHAAIGTRQHSRTRQDWRPALGRHGVGSKASPADCTGEPPADHRQADSAGAARRGETRFPQEGNYRAARRTVCDVARVVPDCIRSALHQAALGRARRHPCRYG